VDDTALSPCINTTVFPNTPAEAFWTSSTGVRPDSPFYVGFETGLSQRNQASERYRVRCVSSSATLPTGRYTVNTDEVLDHLTGLTWRRAPTGGEVSWADAQNACPQGWRLPRKKEMETLVHVERNTPALDVTAFPATLQGAFWTSTPALHASLSLAWYVATIHGECSSDFRTNLRQVLCVR